MWCVFSCSVVSDSAILWTATCPAPLSMEFSRQEYWSGLPFPSPGDLLNPRMKHGSPVFPAWQVDYLLAPTNPVAALLQVRSRVLVLWPPDFQFQGFFFLFYCFYCVASDSRWLPEHQPLHSYSSEQELNIRLVPNQEKGTSRLYIVTLLI